MRGVTIGGRLSSAAIQVKDGDEIRWTNRLKTPVRIILGDYVSESYPTATTLADTLVERKPPSPNESAGLYFDKPGTIRYIVLMQSDLRNREESRRLRAGSDRSRFRALIRTRKFRYATVMRKEFHA